MYRYHWNIIYHSQIQTNRVQRERKKGRLIGVWCMCICMSRIFRIDDLFGLFLDQSMSFKEAYVFVVISNFSFDLCDQQIISYRTISSAFLGEIWFFVNKTNIFLFIQWKKSEEKEKHRPPSVLIDKIPKMCMVSILYTDCILLY